VQSYNIIVISSFFIINNMFLRNLIVVFVVITISVFLVYSFGKKFFNIPFFFEERIVLQTNGMKIVASF
jgi:hypothetical protein